MFAFISIGQYFRQEASWERERWDGIGKILQVGSRTRDAQRALVLLVHCPQGFLRRCQCFSVQCCCLFVLVFFRFVYLLNLYWISLILCVQSYFFYYV